uniref:Uncharacterized protein n=1 Tax=Arundo donax TaxID=35708 RepID=A0A0A9FDT3_ARUDO
MHSMIWVLPLGYLCLHAMFRPQYLRLFSTYQHT